MTFSDGQSREIVKRGNVKRKIKPTPVLLGADLNAYSVAMAFHEAYGVRSHVMGRYRTGLTSFSKIIKIEFCSGYQDIDVFLPELFSFAARHRGETLVLVPCADCYVEFISRHREELSPYYHFCVPDYALAARLCDKIKFYDALKGFNIPYPEFTALYPNEEYKKKIKAFEYPAVLKPAVSSEYWRRPFPEMRKVYYPGNADEAAIISEKIFSAGYSRGLVLQREIKNKGSYVYTALKSKVGDGNFGVFGKVVLEEKGKTSAGNYSAIITQPQNALTASLDLMLERVGYTGFANFDILSSGGQFYVLELNLRQGRSCDHIRCAGINIAKRLMQALGLDSETHVPLFDKNTPYREIFWHYPSKRTAMKHMAEEDKIYAVRLSCLGEDFSALEYHPDLIFNPPRRIYIRVHDRRLARSFLHDTRQVGKSVNKEQAKHAPRGKKQAGGAV